MTDTALALCAFLGGGSGAVLRWLCGRMFTTFQPTDGFPWATMTVNLVGSLALGFAVVWAKDRPNIWVLFGVGLCGGFTTMSTLNWETLRLIEAGRPLVALGYICLSACGGVLGVMIGLRLASLLTSE